MRVSVVQMDVKMGAPESNLRNALDGIDKAANDGAQVVLLPELWTAGYVWLAADDYTGSRIAEDFSEKLETGESISALGRKAQKHNMWVVAGSIFESEDRHVYNTSAALNPQGRIIHSYRKVHLIDLMRERDHFEPGDGCDTFSIDDWCAGITICYDLRFPELFRKLAVDGAEIIFVPAQWPKARIDHWITLARARAIENQCYLVAANRAGRGGDDEFPGESMIISPSGEVIAREGERSCVISADVCRQQVKEIRQFLPVLSDRRREICRRQM